MINIYLSAKTRNNHFSRLNPYFTLQNYTFHFINPIFELII